MDSSSITCPSPTLSLSAVSAAGERVDQYNILQVKNKTSHIYHKEVAGSFLRSPTKVHGEEEACYSVKNLLEGKGGEYGKGDQARPPSNTLLNNSG